MQRWRRYGIDRLYVSRANDVKVGWWDLTADEPNPETPQNLTELRPAVEAWRSSGSSNVLLVRSLRAPAAAGAPAKTVNGKDQGWRVVHPVSAPAGTREAAERPWIDLGTNTGRAAAREQAVVTKDPAPVRTFVAPALGVTTERAWRIGADGEEKVATQLAMVIKKDLRWSFIHATRWAIAVRTFTTS